MRFTPGQRVTVVYTPNAKYTRWHSLQTAVCTVDSIDPVKGHAIVMVPDLHSRRSLRMKFRQQDGNRHNGKTYPDKITEYVPVHRWNQVSSMLWPEREFTDVEVEAFEERLRELTKCFFGEAVPVRTAFNRTVFDPQWLEQFERKVNAGLKDLGVGVTVDYYSPAIGGVVFGKFQRQQ